LQSVARSVASQILTEEVLASCSGGPRGNQQLRIVFPFYSTLTSLNEVAKSLFFHLYFGYRRSENKWRYSIKFSWNLKW